MRTRRCLSAPHVPAPVPRGELAQTSLRETTATGAAAGRSADPGPSLRACSLHPTFSTGAPREPQPCPALDSSTARGRSRAVVARPAVSCGYGVTIPLNLTVLGGGPLRSDFRTPFWPQVTSWLPPSPAATPDGVPPPRALQALLPTRCVQALGLGRPRLTVHLCPTCPATWGKCPASVPPPLLRYLGDGWLGALCALAWKTLRYV